MKRIVKFFFDTRKNPSVIFLTIPLGIFIIFLPGVIGAICGKPEVGFLCVPLAPLLIAGGAWYYLRISREEK